MMREYAEAAAIPAVAACITVQWAQEVSGCSRPAPRIQSHQLRYLSHAIAKRKLQGVVDPWRAWNSTTLQGRCVHGECKRKYLLHSWHDLRRLGSYVGKVGKGRRCVARCVFPGATKHDCW